MKDLAWVLQGLHGSFWSFCLCLTEGLTTVLWTVSFLAGLREGRGQRRPCLWLTLREVDSEPVPEILKWPLTLRRENWDIAALLGPAPSLTCNRAA